MRNLRKLLSLLLVCSLMLAAIPALAETEIAVKGGVSFGGYVMHDFAEHDYNKFITFSGDDPAQYDTQNVCLTTYAAAYYDGIVYGYAYGYETSEVFHDEFYTIDTRNGYIITYPGGSSEGEFVYAMAYNYADDTMYALCDEDHPYIASVDLESGVLTRVVDIDLGSYLGLRGMAITPDGEFYLITMSAVNSRLLTLNMANGSLTEIGATGKPAYYAQSMTCDPATGIVYWAQLDSYSSNGLYSVNTQTAECTFIGKIGSDGMEITCLYVEYNEEPQEPEFILGDADENGEVNMMDALLAMRASMGIVELSELGALAADVDAGGTVTALDALKILRAVMGLDTL